MAEANYQSLSPAQPAWGEVALLPWDTEIFGFAVADFRPGELRAILSERVAFGERLRDWASQTQVELIGCSVAAAEPTWRALLPALGFQHVDSTLHYTVPRLQTVNFRRRNAGVRPAIAEDRAAVELIAERGFRAGRYHADPLFPLALANLRFRRLIAQAFATRDAENLVYVSGKPGKAIGFLHIRLTGDVGYMPIGGMDPSVHNTATPLTCFTGALMELRDRGIRRLESKLSAGNTGMINVAAYGGARFSDPQHVYHWHAEGAPHLLSLDSLAP